MKVTFNGKQYEYVQKKEIYFIEVTPEIAREWLKLNRNNRPTKTRSIEAYASDMKHGKWDSFTTDSPVVFDINGLKNGQNRLLAVIKSGVSVVLPVIFDGDLRAVVYDKAVKRSNRDELIYGNKFSSDEYTRDVDYIVNYAIKRASGIVKTTAAQVEAYFIENHDNLIFASKAVNGYHRPIMKKAYVMYAVYAAAAYGVEKDVLAEFCKVVNTNIPDASWQSSALVISRQIREFKSDGGGARLRENREIELEVECGILDFLVKNQRKRNYSPLENSISKFISKKDEEFVKRII